MLHDYTCDNLGGLPRYDINNNPDFINNFDENRNKSKEKCMEIVKRDLERITPILKLHMP